jgi:hypothetical protein
MTYLRLAIVWTAKNPPLPLTNQKLPTFFRLSNDFQPWCFNFLYSFLASLPTKLPLKCVIHVAFRATILGPLTPPDSPMEPAVRSRADRSSNWLNLADKEQMHAVSWFPTAVLIVGAWTLVDSWLHLFRTDPPLALAVFALLLPTRWNTLLP